jgi:large subunit ribosomal protein L6
MSRIGSKPVIIPSGVEVTIDNQLVLVRGPKGELSQLIDECITLEKKDNEISFVRKDDSKPSKSHHGLSRTLVANMIEGVSNGYEKKLEIIGVGYRAEVKGSNILMQLGFSHPVLHPIPKGVTVGVHKEKNDIVTISGIDKALVGQVAADVRKYRQPEPYKGKGIRYVGEHVKRKEGKKAGE